MNSSILIIDDEVEIRKLLEITLRNNGYKVIQATTAGEGLSLAASHLPDLILLDLGLPDENGQAVLKKLREWYHKPVVILSVQNDEDNIITALDNSANDYLTKPFRTGELLARIRALLRITSSGESTIINAGDLQIDPGARTVKKKNELVKLTATEYTLLLLLVQNEGRVLTHQYILREVWGPNHTPEQAQTLRVFIGQLRKKTETDPNSPEYIHTESRVGYRFRIPG